MSDTVIRVENLSKLYRLGELHKQTNSFRDRVTQAFTRLAPKLAPWNAALFHRGAKPKASNSSRHACPVECGADSTGALCSMRSASNAMPHVHPACPVGGEHRTGVELPTSRDHSTGAHCSVPEASNPMLPAHSSISKSSPSSMRSASNAMPHAPCSMPSSSDDTIWALKDVSFEVKRGEVLGIIGRNGAGKSTLLKILSRITRPTQGKAWINGRVGSLLEVGTGFHPELTGRENIYLNGSILGMRKAEIAHKFDEIVDFAEIAKFIDTPVKRYSSGMYVRLAFAVAAYLEPEILLVDEVLSVGDAMFQKRCLGRMKDVSKGGRTVLFVSHQLTSIRRLCETSIWLDAGHIKLYGPTSEVVGAYEAVMLSEASSDFAPHTRATSNEGSRFVRWEIEHPRTVKPNVVAFSGPCTFKVVLWLNKLIEKGFSGISLRNSDGQLIWAAATGDQDGGYFHLNPGEYNLFYSVPTLPIKPGVYQLHVSLYDREDDKLIEQWHCVPELIIGTSPKSHPRDEFQGILNLPCNFRIAPLVQGGKHNSNM